VAKDATRRGLLNGFLGTSIGAMLGAVFYPVLRYLVPPEIPEAPTNRVSAGKESDLKPNEAKVFAFGSAPALLVRTADGGYKAFSAACTHLNCTVQYRPDMKQIWCACHNGTYDLSGKNVSGPPPRPLQEYALHVADGEIVVEKS
jgi:Rieske Fe-S protein